LVFRAVVADENLFCHGRRRLLRFVRLGRHASCRFAMPAWIISAPTHSAMSVANISLPPLTVRDGPGRRVRPPRALELAADAAQLERVHDLRHAEMTMTAGNATQPHHAAPSSSRCEPASARLPADVLPGSCPAHFS